MSNFLSALPWDLIWENTLQTFQMLIFSVPISYLLGLPLGVILLITSKGHILENSAVNNSLGAIVNAVRSIPFIILLVFVIPFTRIIVGSSIGTSAAIVPLTLAAIPFVARMVESSLKEIEWGLVEAALSMGASPWQIIIKVLIPEAMPSLVLGATITTITLVGYTVMAGFVGAGGLGDLAMRYGFYRYRIDIMTVTIIILIVLVQLLQMLGDSLANALNKK